MSLEYVCDACGKRAASPAKGGAPDRWICTLTKLGRRDACSEECGKKVDARIMEERAPR